MHKTACRLIAGFFRGNVPYEIMRDACEDADFLAVAPQLASIVKGTRDFCIANGEEWRLEKHAKAWEKSACN